MSAEAVSNVELCTFPRSVLEGMLKRHPELEHRLFQQTLMELDEARDWLLAVGRKTARERVAALLYMIARHVPDKTPLDAAKRTSVDFDLPLTRADMADFLGLTIETVSRQITRLRQDGVIGLKANRHVTVPDLRAPGGGGRRLISLAPIASLRRRERMRARSSCMSSGVSRTRASGMITMFSKAMWRR